MAKKHIDVRQEATLLHPPRSTFTIKSHGAKSRKTATPAGFNYSSLSRQFRLMSRGPRKGRFVPESTPCALEKNVKGKVQSRKTCPVQLFFDDGKAFLRFCTKDKQPGPSIAIRDPLHANEVAMRACECWEKNNKSFDKCEIKHHALMGLKRRARARKKR